MKNQKNLSVSGMKKLAKKQEFVDLVSKVLVTQAKAEVVREKVNAYLAPVFAKYELYDDEDQKITLCLGIQQQTTRRFQGNAAQLSQLCQVAF